jgi:Flp pilus assembly protein TadG
MGNHVSGKMNILVHNHGASAIEFAILLPVFVILSLGVIEFGMYFVKDEIANNAVSTVSQTLQRNPGYYASLTPAQLQQVEKSYGSGLIDFTKAGNYLCVDSYATVSQAASAPPCTGTYFNTANPNANGTPYYIAVRANLPKGTITPLGNFVSNVKNIRVAQYSGAIQVGNLIPPDCNQPWLKLGYDNVSQTYTCTKVSFVVASGSSNTRGPGTGWITEQGQSYGDPNQSHYTVCEFNVKFQIPSGLPPGILIPTGTVHYRSSGAWDGWAVSFKNYNAPVGGGTGSMDICISDLGNWKVTPPIGVGAEHVGWVVTFYPN